MPATEKTWRDQARMHVVFGISALVMLGGTIWMMAKDHNREWRKWQLADRAKEHWTIEAQLAQAQADSSAQLDRLRNELQAARSTKVDAALVERFKQLVAAEDERLAQEEIGEAKADFGRLDTALEKLQQAEDGSQDAKAARDELLAAMNDFVREAKRRENALLTQKKFEAAKQTAAISARGIAVGEGRPTAKIESRIQGHAARIVDLDAKLAAA